MTLIAGLGGVLRPAILNQPVSLPVWVAINNFLVDASLSEEHTFESEVTEYPVESGSNISDNIRPKPITVNMECIVTKTPLGTMVTNRDNTASIDPPDDAYHHLLKIRDAREPVTIVTSLQVFENMVMKNLTIPRATGRGDELRFTASFVQIQIVTNKRDKRVAIPIAIGPKTVTKPLVPVAGGQKEIERFRICRNPDVGFLWEDLDIGGWREGVTHLHAEGLNTVEKFGVLIAAPGLIGLTGDVDAWTFAKGHVFGSARGVSKTDAVYQTDISASYEKYRENRDADPYWPFSSVGIRLPLPHQFEYVKGTRI